ncbi:hypothetical protein KAU33_12005 [Candidatus Dependentiae bacterium]|nr:hypothetical protein [Candidatus Dependentiae bacterium]
MKFKYFNNFLKDSKKLKKRYKSLNDDFKVFLNSSLELFHKQGIDQDIIKIKGLKHPRIDIYKVRKFACKSLKGTGSRSGIRIIYAYYPEKDIVEFIEIYYKGDKAREDDKRIKKYLKSIAES